MLTGESQLELDKGGNLENNSIIKTFRNRNVRARELS